ncbi:MAG: serine/threonine protein kinase [Cyanobacteria bacterium RM1_2_2]|nr:serine/threonine protein kinase [Cyanobacteria bacterium RM1_2_2]
MSRILSDLQPNSVLANRYPIERLLGKSAGRRTLLARDFQTHERVVIKVLLFNSEFEWNDLKLFEREAEALQSLSHRAIPRYLNHFDVDTTLGKGFALVQTYIAAQSLEDQLQAGRSFSEAELKQLAVALLEILHYLHQQNPLIIHRDIKPSNILLGDRSGNSIGQVYLVDFGSVQTLAAKQGGTMTVVGTYGYMPPEQFGGRAVPASDLYSLGATLIYLATGQHPADLCQADLQLQFESASLSLSFIRWLKQITEPALNRRFATAEAALQALTQEQPNFTLTEIGKPAGSKLKLHKSASVIEIKMPSVDFSVIAKGFRRLVLLFLLLIVEVCLMGMALVIPILGMITAYIAFFSLMVTGLWLLLVGVQLLHNIGTFIAQFRVRLRIDNDRIAYIRSIFGHDHIQGSASRQDICKLVHTLSHYELNNNGEGGSYYQRVGPRLIIWAGNKPFELVGLTPPEQSWLAQELSEWLNLPIIRE